MDIENLHMRSENIYDEAKKVFEESNDPLDFIKIESNIAYLETLHAQMDKPFKFILLYGPPGIGKSMLMRRFYHERQDGKIIYYPAPVLNRKEFFKKLSLDIFSNQRTDLVEALMHLEECYTILVDEAQMYGEDMLEIFRILADTKKVRFILALHTHKHDDLLAKEHFNTRIYQDIALTPPNVREFHSYLQKRLFQKGCNEIAVAMTPSVAKSIYKFTHGNFRQTDKFLYTLFDILAYFHHHYPSKVKGNKIGRKFVEMSAIHLGLMNA